MKVPVATHLAERLKCGENKYGSHVKAQTPLDKYLGMSLRLRSIAKTILM
jgi:hypothetical protein